jgi:hypothetical protein
MMSSMNRLTGMPLASIKGFTMTVYKWVPHRGSSVKETDEAELGRD